MVNPVNSFSDQMLAFFISFAGATRSRNFDCDPRIYEITLRSAASYPTETRVAGNGGARSSQDNITSVLKDW